MAVTSISAITSLISGTAAVSSIAGVTTGDTVILGGPSGGPLDFNTLVIRVANEATGGGCIVSLEVGTDYSAIGQGAYEVTVTTAGTVYIGGTDFESARFKNTSAQALIMTFQSTALGSVTTAACRVEAIQAPYGHLG